MKALGSMWPLLFLCGAILEVAGDGIIKFGYEQKRMYLCLAGFAIIGSYGLVVNYVTELQPQTWTLSKILGVYVVFFALASVVWDVILHYRHPSLHHRVPLTTWIGLIIIAIGGAVIQLGPRVRSLLRLPFV